MLWGSHWGIQGMGMYLCCRRTKTCSLLGEDGEGGSKDQRKKFQLSQNVREGKKKTEQAKAKVTVTSGSG